MPTRDDESQSVAHVNGRALNDSLRTTGILCWVLDLLFALTPVVRQQLAAPTELAWGLGLVLVHQVLVLTQLWRRRPGRWGIALTGIPLFVGILAMLPFRGHIEPINLWAPGYWAMPWVMAAMIALPRRHYLWLFGLTFPALTVIDAATQIAGGHATRLSLEPVPGVMSPVAILVLLCDGLAQLSQSRDRARALRENAQQAREGQEVESQARNEAARLLHDHVLHALHALARENCDVTPEMMVQECRTAVRAMEHREAARSTDLRELLLADPMLDTAGARLEGRVDPLPTPAALALQAAAHEALRNVERHSGADHCRVLLGQEGNHWRVEVADEGCGFDPQAIPGDRLGISHSIRERLAQVGGEAEVISAPGSGTRIVLEWPARELAATWIDPRTSGAARRVLTRTAWPNLALAPVFTALLHPLVQPTWPVLVATAILFVVGALEIGRLSRQPLGLLDSAVLLGVSIGAWATNLWTAPDDVHQVAYLWLAWGCAALAHLVVLQVKLVNGLVALAGWALAMSGLLVARYGWGLNWADLHLLVTIGAGEALIALVVFHRGERLARQQQELRDTTRALRRATAHLQVMSQMEHFWSRRVTDEALPLLQAVADGSLDPTSPQTRERARRMETMLRDELLLGPEQAELLQALARVREDGWQVTSTLTSDLPSDILHLGARLLEQVGPPAVTGQQLTLSAHGSSASIVILSPTASQLERWEGLRGGPLAVTLDETFARFTLARPGGPQTH